MNIRLKIQNKLARKKAVFIASLSFLCIFTAHAQMDIQLNTYWQNPYYITPAYINDVQSLVFTLSGRKQWVNFNGAPQTIFGSVSTYLDEQKMQFGLRIFNDKMGYTSVTDASLTYAYSLKLNDNWWMNLGVAGSFQSLDYDLSKISFEGDEETDVYSQLVSKKGLNADAGLEVFNSEFRFGLAGRNLVSIFKPDNIHFNTNYIYAIYKQNTSNPVDFGGGIFGIQYDKRYQLEFNATAYFKNSDKSEMFHTGILYRTPKEIGAIVGFNITPSISLSYSYDYNFGISHPLGQTHEIMLVYKFNPEPVMRWDVLN